MVRWIFRISLTILIMTIITVLQVAVREFLPFPFNHINVIFLGLVWLVLFTNSTTVLWLVLPPALLLELFSPLPFGLNSFALVVGLCVSSWLLTVLFTNHSSSIAFLVGLIGMTVYRILFLLLIFFASFFNYQLVFSGSIALEWLSEIFLTNVLLVLVYFTSQRFFKRLQPQYVKLHSLR